MKSICYHEYQEFDSKLNPNCKNSSMNDTVNEINIPRIHSRRVKYLIRFYIENEPFAR